jgi:flavodoxin
MKVEVLYCSRGGSTRKVAEAIASVFGVQVRDMKNGAVVKDFDLLLIGSGNYGKQPATEVSDFLGSLEKAKGRKAAVFGTYGGGENAIISMKSMLAEKSVKVLGTWGCKGAAFLLFNRGRPNEEDLAHAREFAKKIKQSC